MKKSTLKKLVEQVIKEQNNKTMAKENITGRLKELAGIKSENENTEKDMSEEKGTMNESIFGAVAGIMGLFGTAGIMVALEQAAEDPAFQEKHPKAAETLNKIFGFLREMGSAAGAEFRK